VFTLAIKLFCMIKKFEDLRCWQEARQLVKEIYLISEHGKLHRDFDTKSQLKRAALSAMNNIAEGFGKYSSKEFIRYLDTANNSASEVKSILYVLLDLEYFESKKIEELQAKADSVKALCLALIKHLVKRNNSESQTT
jgi:four helix bundle protein